jgi:hypothetical protein
LKAAARQRLVAGQDELDLVGLDYSIWPGLFWPWAVLLAGTIAE